MVLLFVSCPTPFDEDMVLKVNDTIKPEITIISPVEMTECASIVEVSGTVTDKANKKQPGKVAGVRYKILNSPINGIIDFNDSGKFSFHFETNKLQTAFTLQITATDWNGNTTEIQHYLRRDMENGIPSFKVEVKGESIHLSWESVFLAESYTLLYTQDNTYPFEDNGDEGNGIIIRNIDKSETSYIIDQDINYGSLHIFQLKAYCGIDAKQGIKIVTSGFIKALPLSKQTLAPRISEFNYSLGVEWNCIEGIEEYEVYRSERDGTHYQLIKVVNKNSYEDNTILPGELYYYSIRPCFPGSIQSYANCGRSDPISELPYTNVSGELEINGSIEGISIIENFAYIAAGSGGLKIINISDPIHPAEYSKFEGISGSANNITVIDFEKKRFACITTSKGLEIIDVTNQTPAFFYRYPINTACSVAVNSNNAYVACEENGITIIENVFDPVNSQIISLKVQGDVRDVVCRDNILYIVKGREGFEIFDINIPSQPESLCRQDTNGFASGVAVSGNYAYVADGYEGLFIIDISSSKSPNYKGCCNTPGYSSDVAIVEELGIAIVADDVAGVQAISIMNPESPIIYQTYNINNTVDKVELVYYSNEIYSYSVTEDGVLKIIDVTPPLITSISRNDLGSVNNIVIRGDLLYAACGTGNSGNQGLYSYNISDPENPVKEQYVETKGAVYAVDINGKYVYCVTDYGLEIIDIATFKRSGSYQINSGAAEILIMGDIGILSAPEDRRGLYFIDISRPTTPELIHTEDIYAKDIEIQNNFLYVAAGDSGLKIYDISKKEHISYKATCEIPGLDTDLLILKGTYAFTVNSYNGSVQIVDIRDPSTPFWDSSIYITFPKVKAAFLRGKYIYAYLIYDMIIDIPVIGQRKVFFHGLSLINISGSNPGIIHIPRTFLFAIEFTSPQNICRGFAVSGKYAYIPCGELGFRIINLLDE